MPLKTPLRVETKGLWAGIYDADGVLICGNDFATTDTAEDDVKNYAEIVAAVNGRAGLAELLADWIKLANAFGCAIEPAVVKWASEIEFEEAMSVNDRALNFIAALAASTPTQGGE